MKIKDLIESLSEFPPDKEVKIWHEDMGLVETDFVAENVSEDQGNGAAVIFLNFK
jgi:hypothetical protein